MNINWTKWQTLTQFPIVIIMAWATIETYLMRTTSQEQANKNTMPIVVLDIKHFDKYFHSAPIIKNIGYGPAFNIEITDLKNRELKLTFDKVSGLQKDAELQLSFDVDDTTGKGEHVIPHDTLKFSDFLNYKGKHFMSRVSGQNIGQIKIIYSDLAGKKFSIVQDLYYSWVEDELYTSIKEFPKVD